MTWTKLSEDMYVSGRYAINAVDSTKSTGRGKKKVTVHKTWWNPTWQGDIEKTPEGLRPRMVYLGRKTTLEEAQSQCEKYTQLLVERLKSFQ